MIVYKHYANGHLYKIIDQDIIYSGTDRDRQNPVHMTYYERVSEDGWRTGEKYVRPTTEFYEFAEKNGRKVPRYAPMERYDFDPTMNIYNGPGAKVRFSHPQNGYAHEQETARQHLVLNSIYTIEKTNVHSFSTTVYLKEVPGIGFNSVNFSDAE